MKSFVTDSSQCPWGTKSLNKVSNAVSLFIDIHKYSLWPYFDLSQGDVLK